MSVITLIDCDTWIGIYADDKLLYEGHSITPNNLLKLLNHTKIEYFGRYEASLDWLETRGNLPRLLEDVKVSYMGKDWHIFEYIEEAEKNSRG
jgi:hypothetical protein